MAILLSLLACERVEEKEKPIPAATAKPSSTPLSDYDGCETEYLLKYRDSIPHSWCEPFGKNDSLEGYEDSWKDEPLLYEGDYLSFLEDRGIELNTIPLERTSCTELFKDSIEGYAGAWCLCSKPIDDLTYYSLQDILRPLEEKPGTVIVTSPGKTWPTEESPVVKIKYRDSILYRLIHEGEATVLPSELCMIFDVLPSRDNDEVYFFGFKNIRGENAHLNVMPYEIEEGKYLIRTIYSAVINDASSPTGTGSKWYYSLTAFELEK